VVTVMYGWRNSKVTPTRTCTTKEHGTRLSETFFGRITTGTTEFARTLGILLGREGVKVRSFPLKATVAKVMGSSWEHARKGLLTC